MKVLRNIVFNIQQNVWTLSTIKWTNCMLFEMRKALFTSRIFAISCHIARALRSIIMQFITWKDFVQATIILITTVVHINDCDRALSDHDARYMVEIWSARLWVKTRLYSIVVLFILRTCVLYLSCEWNLDYRAFILKIIEPLNYGTSDRLLWGLM